MSRPGEGTGIPEESGGKAVMPKGRFTGSAAWAPFEQDGDCHRKTGGELNRTSRAAAQVQHRVTAVFFRIGESAVPRTGGRRFFGRWTG